MTTQPSPCITMMNSPATIQLTDVPGGTHVDFVINSNRTRCETPSTYHADDTDRMARLLKHRANVHQTDYWTKLALLMDKHAHRMENIVKQDIVVTITKQNDSIQEQVSNLRDVLFQFINALLDGSQNAHICQLVTDIDTGCKEARSQININVTDCPPPRCTTEEPACDEPETICCTTEKPSCDEPETTCTACTATCTTCTTEKPSCTTEAPSSPVEPPKTTEPEEPAKTTEPEEPPKTTEPEEPPKTTEPEDEEPAKTTEPENETPKSLEISRT
jgi:hypothetical protein